MAKNESESLLDTSAEASSEFERADAISRLAAEVGFDWVSALDALDKVDEESDELREALEAGDHDRVQAELGDLIFAIINVARKAAIPAEDALRQTNDKFVRRFRAIERDVAASGRGWHEHSLDELEAIWVRAKNGERPT